MNFELRALDFGAAAASESDALLVVLPDSFKPADGPIDALAQQALKSGDLLTKAGKLLQLYQPAGVTSRRLTFCGAGDGSAQQVRQAVVAGTAALKGFPIKRLTLCLAALPGPGRVQAALTAVAEGSYAYVTTKSKPEPRSLQQVLVGVADAAASQEEFRRACAVVKGVELAKEWANRPANHATPTMLAKTALALGKHRRMKTRVLLPAAVAKLKMGAFMAVAQGSREPLRFIEMRYDGAARSEAPVVLIGKGITFDTGGISIKPAAEMDEMKFDMGGAASVLGVFAALAELQPSINVVGLIPTCENMPGGLAIKPGDVVTGMSGQTIEILNTDAEGRLILSDALTYAERFKPRAVIDIATLTGACVIALGAVRSGMFSTSDSLARALYAAGEAAADPCWRMPLDEDYAEGLKTNFADVANVAGRAAGAVTAAKFLQRFAGKFDWAHLDIAGTAWKSGAAKGATGRPIGLLVQYLLTLASAAPTTPAGQGKSGKRGGART